MAKRKKVEVPRDNVVTIEIGDMTLELEASLGTGITYSNEFRGKLDAPYKGILADDMLHVWRIAQPTMDETVAVDDDGNPVFDDDGKYVPDPNGHEVEVANPEYVGYDIDALLRIAWAMARASGSTKRGFDAFYADVIHQPAGVFEEASLFNAVIMRLGGGIIFRRPTGLRDAGEADEAQEGQEE